MRSTMQSPRKQTLLVIAATLVVLVSGTYLGRGWLRESAVPFYVRTVYLPKVRGTFEHKVLPLNSIVAPYGFTFSKAATDFDGCYAPQYERFSESLGCTTGYTSNKLRPSAALREKWHQSSGKVEPQILAAGWTKDNVSQPIATLLDSVDHADVSQHIVTYRLRQGAITCFFSIHNSPSSDEIFATESCDRTVDFFRGY